MGGEGGFNIEGAPKTMFQDENIFLYHLTIDHAVIEWHGPAGRLRPARPRDLFFAWVCYSSLLSEMSNIPWSLLGGRHQGSIGSVVADD